MNIEFINVTIVSIIFPYKYVFILNPIPLVIPFVCISVDSPPKAFIVIISIVICVISISSLLQRNIPLVISEMEHRSVFIGRLLIGSSSMYCDKHENTIM